MFLMAEACRKLATEPGDAAHSNRECFATLIGPVTGPDVR